MDNIPEMVDEHPFEVELHEMYIRYKRGSVDRRIAHRVRIAAIRFVDFDDETWIEWISDSDFVDGKGIAETISAVLLNHPSPAALGKAIQALPSVVKEGWNDWKVFSPRPTPAKSAVRYVETAIEKVGLFCDSAEFWASVREFFSLAEPNNPEAVRRVFVREINAVPMSHENRQQLIKQLTDFESRHSLSPTHLSECTGEKIWNAWSAMEIRAQSDPSIYSEMITKRKTVDPLEYVRSLYARSVLAAPNNIEYWLDYSRYAGTDESLNILTRAVRNNPYSGLLWLELIKMIKMNGNESQLDQAILMGTSALRDSPNKDPDSLYTLLMADIALKRERSDSPEAIRSSFQTVLSVMQEVESNKHVATAFVSWMNYEGFAQGESIVVSAVQEFLSGDDWENVRAAMTPLQWVQLVNTFRHCGGDSEGIRRMYSVACRLVADKYKPIILNDQAIYEQASGDLLKVVEIRQELARLEKLADQPLTNKGGKKRERQVEEADMDVQECPDVKHRTKVVFLRGIPFNISEQSLCVFLEQECGAGKPVQVLIVRDETGKSRGFGYAEFESFEQASIAVSKSGSKLKNRSVIILPSDREITVKRERAPQEQHVHTHPESSLGTEPQPKKDNDYFRNLISNKQKRNS